MSNTDDAYQWRGRTMIGSDGEKIGKVSEIYEDPATGKAEWATVSSGLFGNKSNFVPLTGASRNGEDIRAQVTKAQVKDAPGVGDDDDLSEQEERRLFEHYGVPYTTEGTTTAQGRPQAPEEADRPRARARADRGDEGRDVGDQGRDIGDVSTDNATSRPEQGSGAGTGQPEGGRRRLRRYVVTEVTTTVPVADEETAFEGGPTDSTRR